MFKKLFIAISIFIFGIWFFFFAFSESYKLSLEARVKYFMGEYEEARVLAREAFELDPYNKMAFSVLAQSKISAQLLDYIEDSKRYLKKIEMLSSKGNFSQSDKVKIKFYCEIQLQKYKKLSPTVMTDKKLYKACTKQYKKFKKIYEELF
jgi:tetratricopeptide (TPR) repeat protein